MENLPSSVGTLSIRVGKSCYSFIGNLVSLHLVNYVQFWSPQYGKDMEALQRVQKWFTRKLPDLEGITNKESRHNRLE